MLRSVDDARVGRLVRVLRQRRGWRQVDLAQRAGVGRAVVSDLEAGRLELLRVGAIRSVVGAFGVSFDAGIRGLGADADRVLDQRHAVLMGACAGWLESLQWRTQAEVTYSQWGERGSIDLLAWHEPSGYLLVVEIKTELASVEETLRKHDEKVRLAPSVASQLGWTATKVGRLLVFPEDRTQRRRIEAHASIMDRSYPMRGPAVRVWCKVPSGPCAGLLFLPNVSPGSRMVAAARRNRIKLPASRSAEHD